MKTNTAMERTGRNLYTVTEKGLYALKRKRERLSEQFDSLKINMGEVVKEEKKISENSGYAYLLIEYNRLLKKIRELDDRICHSSIYEKNKSSLTETSIIEIGSIVSIDIDGEKEEYEIVGQLEGDPLSNTISCDSPLAIELIGREKGDFFKFRGMDIRVLTVE